MTVRRTSVGDVAALEAVPDGEASGRPVLFAHGFTGGKDDAAELLPRFAAAGRRALAIDLRGCSETPGPVDESAYTLDTWAADVIAVARAWGREPVHLIGHSFGGFVARAAAVRAPAAFASVVLLASGIGATQQAATADRIDLVRKLRAGGHAAAWPDATAVTPRDARIRDRFFATEPAALIAAAGVLNAPPDLVPALAATRLPVLVAFGADEDLWPVAELRELAALLGRAPVVIPDSGHVPNETNPDFTADAFEAFWREVESVA
jgi:pimeloyl-ACP methyl ester carboxylesterase